MYSEYVFFIVTKMCIQFNIFCCVEIVPFILVSFFSVPYSCYDQRSRTAYMSEPKRIYVLDNAYTLNKTILKLKSIAIYLSVLVISLKQKMEMGYVSRRQPLDQRANFIFYLVQIRYGIALPRICLTSFFGYALLVFICQIFFFSSGVQLLENLKIV